MKKYLLVCFVTIFMIFSFGCRPSAPKGLAPIRPFNVKVINGNTPVPEVKVVFHANTAVGNAVFTGETDANGIAKMKTLAGSFNGNGVPEGSYKVTLIKYANLKYKLTETDRENMPPAEIKKYDLEYNKQVEDLEKMIPSELKTSDKTTLETTVPGTGSFEIDIAKYSKK